MGKREREETEGEWKMWKSRASRRKKAFHELWGVVGEALPEGVKGGRELWVSGMPQRRSAFKLTLKRMSWGCRTMMTRGL